MSLTVFYLADVTKIKVVDEHLSMLLPAQGIEIIEIGEMDYNVTQVISIVSSEPCFRSA